jgi:serine/threonine protein kinase
MIRDRLGRFELRSELGRGGFADVYLAFDPERGEEVALKVYRISLADPEALAAEQNGVALQRDLSQHAPQVAAIYAWGTDDGYYWVAMEYVPGTDLSKVLDKEPLAEARAVAIACEIAAMLEVCHAFKVEGNGTHGVVHGDIKPENLRLQAEGEGERVRVLDFGIAKPLSGTSTRNLFGSSMFRPPEYLEDGHVDRHTDLWALGVVLYLMVSGQRPFVGRNDEELDTRIRTGAPPRLLPEERSSPRLRRIVYKSLRFDVRERYGSARELRQDLEDLAAGRPLQWERPEDPLDSTEVLRLSGRPAQAEREGGDPNATRRTRAGGGGPTVATGGGSGAYGNGGAAAGLGGGAGSARVI